MQSSSDGCSTETRHISVVTYIRLQKTQNKQNKNNNKTTTNKQTKTLHFNLTRVLCKKQRRRRFAHNVGKTQLKFLIEFHLKALIHEPFYPNGRGGTSEPDLRRIVCQHNRTVETAQITGFNQSVPNATCHIQTDELHPRAVWTRKGQ